MGRSCVIVLGLLLLAGCSEEPRGWTRVLEHGSDDERYYSFVYADRDADVCARFALSSSPGFLEPKPDDRVEVRGAKLEFAGAWAGPYSPGCTNELVINGLNAVTGEVEFDYFNADGDPCRVNFDVRIVDTYEGADGKTHEMSAEDFPILDVGCPRPAVYSAEYSDLDAAYGESNGFGNLVISAWDSAREVCVWARFMNGAELPKPEVEAPGDWTYSGLRFGLLEREACVASNFVVPPTNADYLSDSAPAIRSTGRLTFAGGDAQGGPCSVDVDLRLESQGRFDWTPDDVFMRGSGIPVAGAGCD